MNFQPEVGETIRIFGRRYTFSKHPAVEGLEMPYGQEGRQGTVYQLVDGQASALHKHAALKVFRERFKSKRQIELAESFQRYASTYGLSACLRSVIERQHHDKLVERYNDLNYSILMPWIEGPTWADILLEEKVLTRDECVRIACAFALVMKELEAVHLAHCDLSSSNVLLPYLETQRSERPFADVELVDVEELYAPDIKGPEILPGGSPGYAAEYIQDGVWAASADRFAGAVLLAEMATWHSEDVRKKKADDMSYFAAEEMQKETARYQQIKKVLRDTLGKTASILLERVWKSRSLEDCPSFAEWFDTFPPHVQEAAIRRKQELSRKTQVTNEDSAIGVEGLLEIAAVFEGLGNKNAAQREYRFIVSRFPENKAVTEEINLLLSADETDNEQPHGAYLQEYLEAAAQMEKLEEWNKALLLYARSATLPALDFATKEELEIIAEEVREKIRAKQREMSTEAALQKILREKRKEADDITYVPNPAGKTKKLPLGERMWRFMVIHWKVLLSLGSFLISAGLLVWLYYFTAEKNWEGLIRNGTEAFAQQNYIEAEEFIGQAIEQKPTEDLYAKLATIYISRGRYEQAIGYLENLFLEKKLSQTNQEAQYLIGRAYFLMNDFSNAIDHLEKARKGEKSVYEQDAIRDLVISYARLNQYEKANQLVQRLNASDSLSKAFIANLKGELFGLQGKDMEAIEEFKKAVSLQGDNERYIKNLVDLYIKKNKTNQVDDVTKAKTYEEAISLINILLENDFTNIDYLNRLGQAYYDYGLYYETKGDKKYINLFQQSLISYNQIIDLGIQSEDILLNIGILYDKLKQKGKAEGIYKQVLESYPNSGRAYFVYGLFNLKEKRYKEAFDMLQKVVQLNQNPSETAIAKERIEEMKRKKLI
ncbi:tetratricopeptide repeat protein [Aneurinibacillus aneurinilyticus]|uniref:tetratricopeptide repeat protein n=1 Tax=Aneurinibacillus aneurinilyticus TaxID=1391 RepID=UPI0023F323EC|nr:tetratricopeptide repeat protein [Aneurinibacillus aneurinilyticus]MCI1696622.1 tetratricopeptide repeat protein [Aneurinibacillus aneurinilyticus]